MGMPRLKTTLPKPPKRPHRFVLFLSQEELSVLEVMSTLSDRTKADVLRGYIQAFKDRSGVK